MDFAFRAKNGFCPECIAFGRKWYIMDSSAGSGFYDHCLMSVPTDHHETLQFNNLSEIAAWLDNTDHLERDQAWIGILIRRHTVADYQDLALVEKSGVQYRLDKTHFTLTALPERRQETGWFNSYRECLVAAKKILKELAGSQPSHFNSR